MFSTKLIEESATKTVGELQAEITVSNRVMVKNAIFRAKRDLNMNAIIKLQDLLRAMGGEVKGSGKAKDVKTLPCQICITLDQKNTMFNDLIHAHCSRVGTLVEQKGSSYTYAFKKDDAKKIEEKLAGAKEVKLTQVQGTAKK
jgi:hypothetical protein